MPATGRTTKNTKFMGVPSYESLPDNEYFNIGTANKSYDKIALNMDYDLSSERKS